MLLSWPSCFRLALILTLLPSAALAGRRDALATEFLTYLRSQRIAFEVVKQTDDTLVLAAGVTGDITIALDNMEKQITEAAAGGTEAQARTAVFGRYAGAVRELAAPPAPLALAKDGPFVLPRLVAPDYLANLQDILHRPLGKIGLHVAWVRDGEGSVRYLNKKDLKDLGLTRAGLESLARRNLTKTTPVETLRAGLKGVVAVQRGDSFDAARLLLVPDALRPGESLQAVVPDRDLLILAPVPAGSDWASSRAAAKAAREASSPSVPWLLDRPLLVTRSGFELR